MRRLWVLSLLVLIWACKNDRVDFGPGNSGGAASTTKGGSHAGGASGNDGASTTAGSNPIAPTVEILQPPEVSDPNDDNLLVVNSIGADTVDVVCRVTPSTAKGATAVEISSIKIALLGADGKQIKEVASPASSSPSEYLATFPLTNVPAGIVSFRCSANDTAGHSSKTVISSLLDHGPAITVTSPLPKSSYARQSTVSFKFSVAAAPLSDDDAGAEVKEVSLRVNGVLIDTESDPKHPGVYSAEVDFSDPKQFPPTLTGMISVAISASNGRDATQTESYSILLDGTPPVVTIKSPARDSIIGGQKQLVFTAADEVGGSGIDFNRLVVQFNQTQYTYDAQDPAWSREKDTVSFAFDSTKFEGSVSQVTVLVRAWDLAGNGPSTDTMFLYLDNQAPFVTLTPFQIRAITRSNDGKDTYCSAAFNPLGDTMADGAVGPQFMRFRAFAWDETNGVKSQATIWYAGVDQKHVNLYLQPDSSKPLLLDADGDGNCDSVAPDVKLLPSLNLMPVLTQGQPDNNPSDLSSPPSIDGYMCKPQMNTTSRLCAGHASDLSYVIRQNYGSQHNQSSNDSVIYAGEVGATDSITCTGDKWDVKSVTDGMIGKDGWLCLTAEALDTAGNVGVAAPLRVCLNADPANPPACATSSTPLPSCTDGCTAPPRGQYGDDEDGHPIPFVIRYN